ncbi:MAG TPA: Hint domain-containing protein, partial [Acetobacteraceae bacterium]|nr:Hint domain-containing protein [Acetobacteraceae bacterium]
DGKKIHKGNGMSDLQQLVYGTPFSLMITDGTVAGTQSLLTVSSGFPPRTMATLANGDVVFSLDTSVGYNQLWLTDGTAGGTQLLQQFTGYGGYANIGGVTTVGSNFVFDYTTGQYPGYGNFLWVSDGTAAGTMEVPGDHAADLGTSATIGTGLVFRLDNGLGITDGTAAGTQSLIPYSATGFTLGYGMVQLGSQALFTATSAASGRVAGSFNELWVTDGTTANTQLVATLPDSPVGGTESGNISALTSLGSKALLVYTDSSGASSFWVTDGTSAGTFALSSTLVPDGIGAMTANGLLFTAGGALGVSDGTVAGTQILVAQSSNFTATDVMARLGNDVVFAAGTGANELWITDGTVAGTSMIEALPAGSAIASMKSDGSQVLFTYNTTLGDVLNVTDGTAAGTTAITGASSPGYGLTGSASAVIGPPCFLAGTTLATGRGTRAVEHLRVGDAVLTADGSLRKVIWIGHRHVDADQHPQPEAILPVVVRADAIAPGVPQRDLYLSPDHAIYLNGVLIPVKYLVDGCNILPAAHLRRPVYYHVELDCHDLLLAEGLAAESFLDTGQRGMFAGADEPRLLHPAMANRGNTATWEAFGYAPLVVSGPALTAARSDIALWAAQRARFPRPEEYRMGSAGCGAS